MNKELVSDDDRQLAYQAFNGLLTLPKSEYSKIILYIDAFNAGKDYVIANLSRYIATAEAHSNTG